MSRLLRLSLRAYPRDERDRDGDVLLGCAEELVDAGASSPLREAAGLAGAGLRRRAACGAAELRSAPWRAASERLAVPLALVAGTLWVAGLSARWTGGWPGLGWTCALIGSALALTGLLRGRRGVAMAGWALVLLVAGHDLYAESGPAASRYEAPVFSQWLNIIACFAPLLVLGAGSTWSAPRPDVRGGALWILPAVALGLGASVDQDLAANVLVGGLLAAPLLVALIGRRDPVLRAAAAALAVCAAPAAIWLAAGRLVTPVADHLALPDAYAGAALALMAVAAAAGCLWLARRAARPPT